MHDWQDTDVGNLMVVDSDFMIYKDGPADSYPMVLDVLLGPSEADRLVIPISRPNDEQIVRILCAVGIGRIESWCLRAT